MATKRRRSWAPLIWLLLLVGAGVGGYYWYQQRPGAEALEFRTTPVTKGEIIQSVTASGQLNPVVNVQVGSQVSGIIEKIHVDFNSRVTNGQVIAQLDAATYKARLTQAEAELANTKASLELAQLTAKRSTELNNAGVIARQEHERAVVELHQAEALVKIRQAALESAQVDLARTTIYAPIDGMVISRNVDVGQTVAASFSSPTLFLIANDLAKMQIDALVSEADVGGVREEQQVTFTVEAFPGVNFKGMVAQVRNSPITNQNVVSYDSVIEVPNPEMKLKPGMTATVSIITSNRTDVLKIPNSALRFRPPENARVITDGTNATPASTSPIKMINGQTNYVLANMPAQAQTMMKSYDKNGDGLIDPAEGQVMRAEMMARFASGGGDGAPMARRSASNANRPRTQTLYIVESTNTVAGVPPPLKAIQVTLGISDGTHTEVLSGLKENDQVVIGSNAPPPEATRAGAGPGAPSPFGGGRRRF